MKATKAIKIEKRKPRSRYVAIDSNGGSKVIAEGMTLAATIKRAEKICKDYTLMFVGKKSKTIYGSLVGEVVGLNVRQIDLKKN